MIVKKKLYRLLLERALWDLLIRFSIMGSLYLIFIVLGIITFTWSTLYLILSINLLLTLCYCSGYLQGRLDELDETGLFIDKLISILELGDKNGEQ